MGYWANLKEGLSAAIAPGEEPIDVLVKGLRDASMPTGEPPFSGYGGQGFWNDSNAQRLENLLRLFTGSRIDYEREVGDLSLSSLVMAAANWLGTTLPEAPIEVARGKGKKLASVDEHPLAQLWANPNPYYSGELMLMGFAVSWLISGNVYILKVRDMTGQVVELYYLPHFMVEPQWPISGIPFISHYAYAVDGHEYHIPVEDIIHFRKGMDPNNPRKGLAPTAPVLRELFADHEAANFAAQLLKNFGIPGVIIAPGSDKVTIEENDREEVKRNYQAKFTGDGRGSAMVLSGQIEVKTLSFDPEKLMMIEQRKVAESRWSAVTGIPAAVLGFLVGMEQTKVGATMRELRELAYESFLIPTQRIIAGTLTKQLLPEMDVRPNLKVRFDNSEVRVLQDDRDRLFARINKAWISDEITLDECRTALGYEPDQSGRGDKYYSEVKQMLAVALAQQTQPANDPNQDPAADDPAGNGGQQNANN